MSVIGALACEVVGRCVVEVALDLIAEECLRPWLQPWWTKLMRWRWGDQYSPPEDTSSHPRVEAEPQLAAEEGSEKLLFHLQFHLHLLIRLFNYSMTMTV